MTDMVEHATRLRPFLDEIEGSPGEMMTVLLVAAALATGVNSATFKTACEAAYKTLGEYVAAARDAPSPTSH